MSAHTPSSSHVADLLPAFVNDTLSRPERAQVMAHLADCPACGTELRAWQAIRQATITSVVPDAAAPDVLLERILSALDGVPTPPTSIRSSPIARQPQENVMTTLSMPVTLPVESPARLPWPTRPPASLSRRQDWLTLLAVAALLLLTLGGALLPRFERPLLPELSGVLPWQNTLPPNVPTYRGDWQHSGVAPDAGPVKKSRTSSGK